LTALSSLKPGIAAPAIPGRQVIDPTVFAHLSQIGELATSHTGQSGRKSISVQSYGYQGRDRPLHFTVLARPPEIPWTNPSFAVEYGSLDGFTIHLR
jgi:hypothetical protein